MHSASVDESSNNINNASQESKYVLKQNEELLKILRLTIR